MSRQRSIKIVLDERCQYFRDGEIRCSLHRTGKQYCKAHEIYLGQKKVVIKQKTCPLCIEDVDLLRWFGCGQGCCSTCIGKLTTTKCPFCQNEDISKYITKQQLSSIKKNERAKAIENGRINDNLALQMVRSFAPVMLPRYEPDYESTDDERRNRNRDNRQPPVPSIGQIININGDVSDPTRLLRSLATVALSSFFSGR